MDVAALVVSLLALVIAVAAVWYTRKQARTAQRELEINEERHARYAAPWRVEVFAAHALSLVNAGDEPAFDVEIEFPTPSEVRGYAGRIPRMSPGSAEAFTVKLSRGSGLYMTVTWSRQPGGERHDWTVPVPLTAWKG